MREMFDGLLNESAYSAILSVFSDKLAVAENRRRTVEFGLHCANRKYEYIFLDGMYGNGMKSTFVLIVSDTERLFDFVCGQCREFDIANFAFAKIREEYIRYHRTGAKITTIKTPDELFYGSFEITARFRSPDWFTAVKQTVRGEPIGKVVERVLHDIAGY